jgi:hypothetical protein
MRLAEEMGTPGSPDGAGHDGAGPQVVVGG